MVDPDKDIKPYHDNVWVLKRVGLTLLAFYVALPFAPVLEAVGTPHAVAAGYILMAILLFFAALAWWFVQDARREKRRKAEIRALRSEESSLEQPVIVARRAGPQRTEQLRDAGRSRGLIVRVPLIVIGASAHIVALTDAGFALIVLELLVGAIVLPAISAKRRRNSRQPTSSNPQPS